MKIIFFLHILIIFVFSNEYKISQIINQNNFIIKTNDNLKLNKTLFVISKQNHILALAKIINENENTYKISILEKNPFKNKNIPYLKYKLNIQDKVINKLFDNNAMIISPDFKNFQLVKNKFKNKNFLSPDLLISFNDGTKNITKEDFFDFAKQYNLSYYYFVFNDGIYIKDAFSLKTIQVIKQDINHKSKTHQFFNNIQDSFSSLDFSFGSDDFDTYYKKVSL